MPPPKCQRPDRVSMVSAHIPTLPTYSPKKANSSARMRHKKHQITAQLARTSQSRYMCSTNATNRQNRQALYFDAANAAHYGKYLNDMWTDHGNNCKLKWNPATGRVEVYAL